MSVQQGDQITPFFATPIFSSVYSNYAQERAGLLETVYEISRQAQEGKQQSGVQNHPKFANLVAIIKEKARDFATSLKFDLEHFDLVMTALWVNVNPKYSFHEDHIHAKAHFSGVFYLQCPENCGHIRFRDPREASLMLPPVYAQGAAVGGREFRLPPKEGGILIFPAWLGHAVGQNMSEGDRVSLSFNFVQVPKRGLPPKSVSPSGTMRGPDGTITLDAPLGG